MSQFLVFRLYGPMASWGEVAVGEHRPSSVSPSKSTIVGLLAAALGIRREEEDAHQQLERAFGLGVRLDRPGELLRDYHTIQVPPQRRGAIFQTRRDELSADRLYTILSQRDYRTDAACTVALWVRVSAPRYTLAELGDALCRPRFTLYLGRKSCPLGLPLIPRLVGERTLREALAVMADQQPIWLRDMFPREPAGYYWEDLSEEEAGLRPAIEYPRRDVPLRRHRWQFVERQEFYAPGTLGGQAK